MNPNRYFALMTTPRLSYPVPVAITWQWSAKDKKYVELVEHRGLLCDLIADGATFEKLFLLKDLQNNIGHCNLQEVFERKGL